ncbi:phage antirepressor KilAC domain-containing protein [Bacillus pretiosus]|uniref:phage antirepressor KilAC domain-containing protein n=1 Tax=Bacillus pretiosus TaxID=2983392 RepID=UPI002ED7B546
MKELELVMNKGAVAGRIDELIESKAQRDELAGRIGVLEKVKGLLLLPNTEFALSRQVAEFYEVPYEAINTIVKRYREELVSDGMQYMTFPQIRELVTVQNEPLHKMGVSYRGCNMFNRRSILRIGMLLKHSEVAKEVRTQLLNIEEKAGEDVKVAEINNELELQMELAGALMSGDVQGVALVNAKIIEYKNRHIAEVEAKLNEVKEERDSLGEKVTEFIESDEVYSFGDVAVGIDGMSAQALRKFLQEHGVLGHKSRGDVYRPIGKYRDMGWFSMQTRVAKWSGVPFTNTYITTKGRMEIAEFYKKMQAKEMIA